MCEAETKHPQTCSKLETVQYHFSFSYTDSDTWTCVSIDTKYRSNPLSSYISLWLLEFLQCWNAVSSVCYCSSSCFFSFALVTVLMWCVFKCFIRLLVLTTLVPPLETILYTLSFCWGGLSCVKYCQIANLFLMTDVTLVTGYQFSFMAVTANWFPGKLLFVWVWSYFKVC